MNFSRLLSAAGLCISAFLLPLGSGPVPAGKPTAYPDWWFERDVIPRGPSAASELNPNWPDDYPSADDFAVANLGQLKYIASKAADQLNGAPNIGAGSTINSLIASWSTANPARDDYATVNSGQLKYVASLFYDRLAQLGYVGVLLRYQTRYPWADTGADDFAVVNLGQLKLAFSFLGTGSRFDSYMTDADLDGIPSGWELEQGLNPSNPADASNLIGGVTYLQLYKHQMNSATDPSAAHATRFIVYTPGR
jgi:hypothetical protein